MNVPIKKKDFALVAFAAGVAAAVCIAADYAIPRYAWVVAVAGVVALVLVVALALFRRVEEALGDIAQDQIQVEPMIWLNAHLSPKVPFPPMRGYAISPDFAAFLVTLIEEAKPLVVVETGSGVSTLVIAECLRRQGSGRCVSLELNPEYAAKTRRQLQERGLDDIARVVLAPLADVTVDGDRYRWHDPAALADVSNVDLVVDDGPPKYVGDNLRFASLPLLRDKLSARGVFVLSFVADEERATVERWRKAYPEFAAESVPTRKGTIVLRKTKPASARAADGDRP